MIEVSYIQAKLPWAVGSISGLSSYLAVGFTDLGEFSKLGIGTLAACIAGYVTVKVVDKFLASYGETLKENARLHVEAMDLVSKVTDAINKNTGAMDRHDAASEKRTQAIKELVYEMRREKQ